MTLERITAILTEWHRHMREFDRQMDVLRALCGSDPDAPLSQAVWNLMASYTLTISEQIEFDESTLMDWWTAHEFGQKPMRIKLANDADWREISTIEALAQLIADHKEQEDQ